MLSCLSWAAQSLARRTSDAFPRTSPYMAMNPSTIPITASVHEVQPKHTCLLPAVKRGRDQARGLHCCSSNQGEIDLFWRSLPWRLPSFASIARRVCWGGPGGVAINGCPHDCDVVLQRGAIRIAQSIALQQRMYTSQSCSAFQVAVRVEAFRGIKAWRAISQTILNVKHNTPGYPLCRQTTKQK